VFARFRDVAAMQDNPSAHLFTGAHLHQGRKPRHDDGDRHAQHLAMIAERGSVVPRRGRNHAPLALLLGQQK
jgi:hypothetical protein